MAVGDLTRAVLRLRVGNIPISHVRYYETTQSIGPKWQEYEGLAHGLNEVYFGMTAFDDLADFSHVSVVFDSWKFRQIQGAASGAEFPTTGTANGQLVYDSLDIRYGMLIRRNTSSVLRRFIGRNYLYVGTESEITAGKWNDQFAQNVLVWMERGQQVASQLAGHQFKEINYSTKYEEWQDVETYGYSVIPSVLKKRLRR